MFSWVSVMELGNNSSIQDRFHYRVAWPVGVVPAPAPRQIPKESPVHPHSGPNKTSTVIFGALSDQPFSPSATGLGTLSPIGPSLA